MAKTKELIEEAGPVALVGMMGTGPMEELVGSGLLAETGLPVVGIRSGAVSLYDPVNPYLFHTRTSYDGELNKILHQLSTIGLYRVAVLYENSSFGKEGLTVLEHAIKTMPKMQLVAKAINELRSIDVPHVMKTLQVTQPDAVIVIANSRATAEFYKAWKQSGAGQVYALFLVDISEVIELIGKEMASGLVVTQVIPDPTNRSIPLVREVQDNMKKYARANTALTQTYLEGYLNAKVLGHALMASGSNPSRKAIRAALEATKHYDAGGIVIDFSSTNHTGTHFVELAIVLRDGKLMR